MNDFPTALGLTADRTELAIRLAGMAPSLHNSQPWRFRLKSEAIELFADHTRRLPVVDPADRELRLACGAALLNLRLALEHFRLRPSLTLMPDAQQPGLLARVSATEYGMPAAEQIKLFRVIRSRRTNRRPFLPKPVPDSHRRTLVRAVESEHGWLHPVNHAQRTQLHKLVSRAHEAQMSDHAFRAEVAQWSGYRRGARDGLREAQAGSFREQQAEWVLRHPRSNRRVPGKEPCEPMLVVLCSEDASPESELRAGQALQRVLLTATALGLAVSFVSQIVEVDETRAELVDLLDGPGQPQTVLRVGYGSPAPATPRRLPRDLLIDELSGSRGRSGHF